MLIEGQDCLIIEQGRPVPLMMKGDPRLGQSSFALANMNLPVANSAAVPLSLFSRNGQD